MTKIHALEALVNFGVVISGLALTFRSRVAGWAKRWSKRDD